MKPNWKLQKLYHKNQTKKIQIRKPPPVHPHKNTALSKIPNVRLDATYPFIQSTNQMHGKGTACTI